eukprot:39123_1
MADDEERLSESSSSSLAVPALFSESNSDSSSSSSTPKSAPKTILINIRSSNWDRCSVSIRTDQTVGDIKPETYVGLKLNPNDIAELVMRYNGNTLTDDQIIADVVLDASATLYVTPSYRKIEIFVDIFCMMHHGFTKSCTISIPLNASMSNFIRAIHTTALLTHDPDCALYFHGEELDDDRWKTLPDHKITDGSRLLYKHKALSDAISMIDAVVQWIDGCMDSREFHSNPIPVMEPIARTLLCGVYDDTNIFSHLRGIRYILKAIWEWVGSKEVNYWEKWIKTDQIYAKQISSWNVAVFPPPTGINVNMMPFIMSNDFSDSKLPLFLESYWTMVRICLNSDDSQRDKIGYLTVHESMVKKGNSQRRGGLHTETVGSIEVKGEGHNVKKKRRVGWGGGYTSYLAHKDGLYIGSNVDASCAIWNCKIMTDEETGGEIIGELGNVEHLRTNVGRMAKKLLTTKDQIYWVTDRTPHESLPFEEDVCRQFFRLVTHNVTIWYEEHNTKNPNGVVPNPDITQIIRGNKFQSAC